MRGRSAGLAQPACSAAPRCRSPTSALKARRAGWAPNSWPSPPRASRQRYYLPPRQEHEKAADVSRPEDVPDSRDASTILATYAPNYGMASGLDLFTNRQLTTLTTFSDLV